MYLKLSADQQLIIEYVIAVPSHYQNDMQNAIIDQGGGYIMWHAPITGNDEISAAFPPSLLGEIRMSMMHRDNALSNGLQHSPTDRKAFNIFPKMHTFSELYSLVITAIHGKSGFIVTKTGLQEFIGNDLFYMDRKYIDEKVEQLLRKGQEIEFLEYDKDEDVFKIKGSGTNRSRIEINLQDKWLKYQSHLHLSKEKNERIEQIQKEFAKERDKQKKLF